MIYNAIKSPQIHNSIRHTQAHNSGHAFEDMFYDVNLDTGCWGHNITTVKRVKLKAPPEVGQRSCHVDCMLAPVTERVVEPGTVFVVDIRSCCGLQVGMGRACGCGMDVQHEVKHSIMCVYYISIYPSLVVHFNP
jgi:hypothetical protein